MHVLLITFSTLLFTELETRALCQRSYCYKVCASSLLMYVCCTMWVSVCVCEDGVNILYCSSCISHIWGAVDFVWGRLWQKFFTILAIDVGVLAVVVVYFVLLVSFVFTANIRTTTNATAITVLNLCLAEFLPFWPRRSSTSQRCNPNIVVFLQKGLHVDCIVFSCLFIYLFLTPMNPFPPIHF